jgi:NitT/TauT family transport system ATP-binding protein
MKVENLSFSYNPETIVFRNFNFESEDRYIFFQGLSGCGKSTLLKLFTDNLSPTSGTITFDDNDGDRRCLILQEDALFPWLSGIQNITALLGGISMHELESNVMYNYTRSFINKKAYQMSFGQRRLIELFRAILLKPTFLCLDEPFNYLDEKSRKIVSEIIFNEGTFGETKQIVMTTHYMSDITDISGIKYAYYYFNGQMPYDKLEKRK